MVLEQIGHHEVVTSRLRETIQKVEDEHPDLVVLDGGLYLMDSENICKRIKSSESTKHLPLLLFSTQTDLEESSKRWGADDYLSKPFELNQLLQKVEILINKAY